MLPWLVGLCIILVIILIPWTLMHLSRYYQNADLNTKQQRLLDGAKELRVLVERTHAVMENAHQNVQTLINTSRHTADGNINSLCDDDLTSCFVMSRRIGHFDSGLVHEPQAETQPGFLSSDKQPTKALS